MPLKTIIAGILLILIFGGFVFLRIRKKNRTNDREKGGNE
jgi:LPXTG-motif cell wall-anchored protein